MVVRVVPASRLPDGHRAAWDALQAAHESLESPFFRPEFAEVVGAARPDAAVAVVEDADGAAYLPFQRARGRRGLPIGARLSDYHGLVAPPEAAVDAGAVVRALGLRSLELDAVPASQQALRPYAGTERDSPRIDLSEGFDAFAAARRRAGSDQLDDVARQRRRLAEQVGELRVEVDSEDPAVLAALLSWKSEQYRATGAVDIFAYPWVVEVARRVHRTRADRFGGLLSALWAGETLVAAHLGLRSATVWHYWLPAYDRAHARYSPGLVLLIELARAAPALGLRAIDLGKGDALYKRRLATGAVELLRATVTPSPVRRGLDAAVRVGTGLAGRTALAPAVRRAATRRRFS